MAKEWIVPDADLGCDGAYFDYQELVRCGDCKYHMAETERTNPYCAKYHRMRSDDWFCADGEREVQDADT